MEKYTKEYAKFGYKNYAHMLRSELNAEILEHARSEYDKWTKYVLKHKDCPEDITKQYATSDVWYQRIAAVMPKNKYRKFKDILKSETDSRVLRFLNQAEEINYG